MHWDFWNQFVQPVLDSATKPITKEVAIVVIGISCLVFIFLNSRFA